jgi:putative oxidoreductase
MTTLDSRSSHPTLSMADAMAANTADFLVLFGRILMGWIFLRSGYGKIFDIAAYSTTFPARGLMPWMAYISVPAEFFGGLALILGIATRYVATVLVVFVLVASFSSHAYWLMSDANLRRINDSSFWKNMAMIGGLLFLFVSGPGRLSVDRLLARR